MSVPGRYQDPLVIAGTLRSARTVAIVGLSPDPLRPSNFIGFYLKRHGYRVIPVNPREREVLGEKSYPSLRDVPTGIDVVDVFRRPDAVPDIARDAVAVGARTLWLQFGVISPEGARIAADGGLRVVMDRCMKVEHARHLGRMHWLGFNTGVVTARRARVVDQPSQRPDGRPGRRRGLHGRSALLIPTRAPLHRPAPALGRPRDRP